jgi:signal transduction histidine kinase
VDDGELHEAAAHARACLARLGSPLSPGPLAIDSEPLPPPLRRAAAGRDSFAVLPLLLGRSEVRGALYAKSARQLSEADLAFLSAAADQFSLAWDRHAAWQREVRLRERAEALDRAQRDLATMVSHDLRNPLSAVLLGISTMRRWPHMEPAKVREHLDTMHRAAERASRLVRDLLDVARLDAGHLQLELGPADPAALLHEAAELMQPLLTERKLACDTQVEEKLPMVLCDRERVLQIFSNLMGNACKFAPAGGTISLVAWQDAGELRYCVADDGPGIAPADLPHVFDRYFQGPHAAGGSGMGLGLSIARGIVEAHGGRIWAESEPGRKTRFVFTLPFCADLPLRDDAPLA